MPVQDLLTSLGPEIEDPEEESFLIFSQSIPSQNLGFIDSKSTWLDISIGGCDLTIHQSPTILSSDRNGGTTGAVVWKITPLVAAWIISPDNPLFKHHVLRSTSSVLELGCGISGILGLILGPTVQQYVLTDQEYVMKFLRQNLLENIPKTPVNASQNQRSKTRSHRRPVIGRVENNIIARSLDWETDEVSSVLTGFENDSRSFDAIIACDCIYNDALIQPLVQTCVDLCQLRKAEPESLGAEPTVCIIAQQLRSAEVFDGWLKAFHKVFKVWRLPDSELTSDLVSDSGFVVHFGVLRENI